MMRVISLSTPLARNLREGHLDANNRPAERTVSDGDGNPCRHCLQEIPEGAEMLVFACRPFDTIQPYAEVGPVFICADSCIGYPTDGGLPPLYAHRTMLIRGYNDGERIVYGTGKTVTGPNLLLAAQELLNDHRIAFVHVRSSTNNCFHFRLEK